MGCKTLECVLCAVGSFAIIVAVGLILWSEDFEVMTDFAKDQNPHLDNFGIEEKSRSFLFMVAGVVDICVIGAMFLLAAAFLVKHICTRSCWENVFRKLPICLQDRLLSSNSVDDVENLYIMESSHGARLPPSRCALWLCPACAISGYETGDPLDGIWHGDAWKVLCYNALSCCIWGSVHAALRWKANPENIQGDGTQRSVNRPCATACLVGNSCTIGFWESGDLCTGLCRGDAKQTCILCWKPQAKYFRRTSEMHGSQNSLSAPPQHRLASINSARQLQQPLCGTEVKPETTKIGNYYVLLDRCIVPPEGMAPRRRSLGVKNSMEECLAALQGCQTVYAGYWRADDDKILFAIDIYNRIHTTAVRYSAMPGIVSFQKCWISLPNVHIDLSSSAARAKGNYKGGLGEAWTAAECISVLQDREEVNYAVWRQDKDNTLHIFDMAERMDGCRDVTPLTFFDLQGATSFQASTIKFN